MARPKGTLKFRTPKDFEDLISDYFGLLKNDMPTKAGLALYLDTTRETLGDYEKRDGYSYTLKRAYYVIENAWVQRLTGQAVAGVIFYLKNAFKNDYRDRNETDITTAGKPLFLPSDVIKKYNLNDRTPDKIASGNSK